MPEYPSVDLVLSIGTWTMDVDACPDTGFEGGLIIPAGVGLEVLAEPETRPFRLADQRVVYARAWSGVVELNGQAFPAEIVATGGRFLLGREVLDQLEICFEFGRRVRLRFADALGARGASEAE